MVDPIVQKATFKRNATKDAVTNTVNYEAWNPKSQTLPAVAIDSLPKIDGYQVDPKTVIAAVDVNPDTQNMVVNVNYYKNKEYNESSSPDYWYDYNNVKKPIKKDFMFSTYEGSSEKTTNDWITVHSTATPNATARNEAQYFKNNWRSTETYVQLVVDDVDCYLVGSIGYVAWGAGYTANHKSPVQIELCEFPNDPLRAQRAYINYVHLIRQFCSIRGIPKLLDRDGRGVKTHNYLARTNHETTHTDPQTYLNQIGISFDQFRSDVEGTSSTGNTGTDTGEVSDPSQDTNGETWWSIDPRTKLPVGFVPESGTFHANYQIKNRRSAPSLTNHSSGTIYYGQSQRYDSVAKIDGYTWIHYRVGRPANGKYEKPESFKGTTYREYYLPVRQWHADGSSTAWGWFS